MYAIWSVPIETRPTPPPLYIFPLLRPRGVAPLGSVNKRNVTFVTVEVAIFLFGFACKLCVVLNFAVIFARRWHFINLTV